MIRRLKTRHNLLHSLIMLMAMLSLVGLIGWILAGQDGVIITVGFGSAFTIFGRGASKKWMLQGIGARPLTPDEAPGLYAILHELCRRAGVDDVPDLHLLDAEQMFGFSAGADERDASIVLTGPLVQGLSAKEIAGVLAHEVSHIHAGDLVVMGMADMMTRMTRTLSLLGLVLIIFNVPIAVSGSGHLPWAALVLLAGAPMANMLLQMSLSRTREFDADAGGVDLSGDSQALADALYKLEIQQRGLWSAMFLPQQPGTEPSMLRSHPVTEERVKRIMSQAPALPPLPKELVGEHHGFPPGWTGELSLPIRWLMRWWR